MHRLELYLFFFHILKNVLCPFPQNSQTCTNQHVKINCPHSYKLLLQKILLKIKLRKFLQKSLTPEKIIISVPANNPKNQNFEKWKKKCQEISSFYTSTANDDHIMYGSWDMEKDICWWSLRQSSFKEFHFRWYRDPRYATENVLH